MEKNLTDFMESIKDFNLFELEKLQEDIDNKISNMILDCDLTLKAAVVSSLIEQKKEEMING